MKRILMTLMALGTLACSNADSDLETAFCDGLEAPAARSVSATTNPAGAPDASDEQRVDIQLQEQDGQYRGFVSYLPDETGSFAFGLSADIGFVVRDAAGNEVALSNSQVGASQCSALAVRHTAPLSQQTYNLELGPSPVAVVSLIAEESDDDL